MPGSQKDLEDLEVDAPESGKKKSESKSSSRTSQRASATQERELKSRLSACFDRISEALTERGDEELAELVRDDGPVMAQGLVSLTRPFRALRTPLLALVAIIEPLLAFGRVLRLLGERWQARRYARAAAQEQAMQEAAQSGGAT